MPILKPGPNPHSTAVDQRIARTLWQWLALGAIAMLLVPAARGPVYLLGNMPFWLVLAPGFALLTLYRHALVAAWRAHLVRATPRRRRRFITGQAVFRRPTLRRSRFPSANPVAASQRSAQRLTHPGVSTP
jgi:hypothetical protein